MGHVVKVLAPVKSPYTIDQDNLIPVGRPIPVPSGGSIARISLSVWRERRVKAILKEEAFDVIHLHEPLAPVLPLTVLRFSNTANVGTFHAFHGRGYMYWFGKRIVRRWFNKLDARIAVSEPARQFVSGSFPGDYHIVPNGIDVDFFAEETAPFDAFNDGKLNILFVGRMEKRKGLKYLLQAFSRLKWEYPNTRLIVVGPGNPGKESYRIMAERNLQDVVFVGRVTDEQKRRYFKTAHIFCAPNTGKESFGIVLGEAMASGRPIVASDISGFASVMTNDKEGFLVPPKNDEMLYAGLKRLIDSPELRFDMGKRGLKRVQTFRWEKVAAQVTDIYKDALDRRAGSASSVAAVGH